MRLQIVPFFQNVLLIGFLPRVVMMEYIGNSVCISPIRNDANMALENHNVSALPPLDLRKIRGQRDGRVGKINL